jgi:polar amino acid transport system substrate-binding protein
MVKPEASVEVLPVMPDYAVLLRRGRCLRVLAPLLGIVVAAAQAEGLQSLNVLSPPLKAAVSDTNAVPFAIFASAGQLSGGLAKDLLDLVGTDLRSQVMYLDIPRARLEPWLVSGQAEVGCFLNPQWVSEPKRFDWTDTLFFSRQLIIRRRDSAPVRQLADLYYKRVGTTFGFVYPELQQAFVERLITRDDAHSLQSNLQRLAQQRLDAVMTVDLSFFYLMQHQQFDADFVAEPMWSDAPGVFCAVSQQSPRRQAILRAFSRLKAEGVIDRLLQKYQGPAG